MLTKYGFMENVDFVGCKVFNTLARQEVQEYILSIEMAIPFKIVNVGRVATDVGRDTTEGVGRETTGKKNNILNNNNINNKTCNTS